MQVGMIGLGRMGGNMAERLRRAGHEVVGYARSPQNRDVASLKELASRLSAPRTVWIMIPAGPPTRQTISELKGLLAPGDLVIDGGNSHYTEDQAHAKMLGEAGIHFVDTGVSGGVWGLQNGYGLMVGGDDADVNRVMPIFQALKPEGDYGFVHAGKVGAGHFAKMVHNGIEYGIMQAYAEGYELLAATDMVTDVAGAFCSWRQGTVDRAGRDRPCRPDAGDQLGPVRAVHLPPGRLPGDEGRRRPAQPVRRPRSHRIRHRRRHCELPSSLVTTPRVSSRCAAGVVWVGRVGDFPADP